MGQQLVERSTRSFALTPAGEEVAARAPALLTGAEDLVRSASGRRPLEGPITLGVVPTIAPGIRRLLTLAMMIALNRPEEFKLHVRAGIDGGITAADMREVILQAAVYCGVPAANSAIKWAEEVFAAQGVDVESPAQQKLSFAP